MVCVVAWSRRCWRRECTLQAQEPLAEWQESAAVAGWDSNQRDGAPEQCRPSIGRDPIDALNKVITSLKGQDDTMAVSVRAGAREQLKQLRIQITKSKFVDTQIETLEALVQRRQHQYETACEEHADAVQKLQDASQELQDGQQHLADIHQLKEVPGKDDANAHQDDVKGPPSESGHIH